MQIQSGWRAVACFSVTTAPPYVTTTSTFCRTNSAANSATRSGRPSDQRYSIATVRPSIQPSSRNRSTKAVVRGINAEAFFDRNPMVGSLPACCERAASGHAKAAPLRSVEVRAVSFNHLVGEQHHGLWDRQPKRLRSLEVDDQFVFGRLLYRQVSRLLALEDAGGIERRLDAMPPPRFRSVGHQRAAVDELAKFAAQCHPVLEGEFVQSIADDLEKEAIDDKHSAYAFAGESCESGFNLAFGSGHDQ